MGAYLSIVLKTPEVLLERWLDSYCSLLYFKFTEICKTERPSVQNCLAVVLYVCCLIEV